MRKLIQGGTVVNASHMPACCTSRSCERMRRLARIPTGIARSVRIASPFSEMSQLVARSGCTAPTAPKSA